MTWVEFLDFAVHDADTRAIAVYAKSISDPALFMGVAPRSR